ncbi:MAG: acyltransferase family protein, partial [Acidobacteria bacterium]|nr:acyltransferase family protein [Acidobacteriota bacterium]
MARGGDHENAGGLLNPRPEEHITFLDTLRGIAIALVFAFHSLGPSFGVDHLAWSGWLRDFSSVRRSFLALLPASLGWSGVAIFFVVSGFCIHLSHERSRRKGFKVFFIRRFFRIYPPYL